MGRDAREATEALEHFLAAKRHLLPKSYAQAALCAVKGDADGLASIAKRRQSGVQEYAKELLERMESNSKERPADAGAGQRK